MAIQNKQVLKSYFETGDIPTQDQFGDLIDTNETFSVPRSYDIAGTGDVWVDLNASQLIDYQSRELIVINHNDNVYLFSAPNVGQYGQGAVLTDTTNYVDVSNLGLDKYLPKDGSGEMTGALEMNDETIHNLAEPFDDNDATTKIYVDEADNLLLPLDGGRDMTGNLNVNGEVKATDGTDKAVVSSTSFYVTDAGGSIKEYTFSITDSTFEGDIYADGNIEAGGQINVGASNIRADGLDLVLYNSDSDIYVSAEGNIYINSNGGSVTFNTDIVATTATFTSLPISDPISAGKLWNDGGTVKISAG